MSTRKSIIFITSRFPFPLTKGDKLRAYYQIRDLSNEFDIILISLSESKISEQEKQELEKYCKEIHVFQLNKLMLLFSLFIGIFRKKPFQVSYFYQRGIQQQIDQIIKRVQPFHIFTQLIRTTEYVKNYHHCKKTLDYMDALSKGMERRYETSKKLYKLIYKIESDRLKAYERSVFDYFENHLIISKQDQRFILHPSYNKIQIISNGIGEHFFEKIAVEKKNDIVFVGNLSYPPNVKATEYLYENIHLKNPNFHIQISGADPAKHLLKLSNTNFKVTGFIDDIRLAYSSSKLFVAPMWIGTGLQNKILEAMAQGVPCITTPLVNRAIQAKPDLEIIIAETEAEFHDKISEYLSNQERYNLIQSNAETFVTNQYSWKKINQQLIQIINN